MEIFKQILIGFVIGAGLILPGVSGGVLAVVFGLYDKIIKAISNFFSNWRKNITFLTPILIGIIIGVFVFGNILKFFFDQYPNQAKYIFMGLIIGALPIIFNKLKKKNLNYPAFLGALFITLGLLILKNLLGIANNIDNTPSFILLFIAGVLYIAGKIIPGISGSFLLILIGMYEYILNIIVSFFKLTINDFLKLFPFGLGIIIGGLLLVKIIDYILKRYYIISYSAILGFTIGSIPILFPGISFNAKGFINIILFLIALFSSYFFAIKNKN